MILLVVLHKLAWPVDLFAKTKFSDFGDLTLSLHSYHKYMIPYLHLHIL